MKEAGLKKKGAAIIELIRKLYIGLKITFINLQLQIS